MAEISEGLINGDFDSVTGEYLGEGEGFARSIYWDNKKGDKPIFFKSPYHAKKGVIKYLENHGLLTIELQEIIITEYAKMNGLGKIEDKISDLCVLIQEDFKKFAKFVRLKKKELNL